MKTTIAAAMTLAFVGLALPGSAPAALVGHWSLDNDTTGLQNLGADGATSDLFALDNAPTFNATGGFDGGGYANFNGTSQALWTNVAGNAGDDLAGLPFTVAAWVRATGNIPLADRGFIIGVINNASTSQYFVVGVGDNNDGNIEAVRRNVTHREVNAENTSSIVHDGDWHHIAAVFIDNTNLEIYLDGSLVSNTPPPPYIEVTFPTEINSIGIGALSRGLGGSPQTIGRFTGDVDDARIYDTALSAQEIAALADVATPGDFDNDGDVDGADFVVWQTNFPTATDATLADGDADGDGDVDGADFVVWQTNFPTTPGSGTAPVPEPQSVVLLVLGSLVVATTMRRGK